MTSARIARELKFYRFRKKMFALSKIKFNKVTKDVLDNVDYDAFVCGSDQIWNPNWFHPYYYANYKEIVVNKMAYAPSIGVTEIGDPQKEKYRKLLKNIEDKVVFSKDEDSIWICRNCGHVVIGKYAPEVCPVCNHPQSYFELKKENY